MGSVFLVSRGKREGNISCVKKNRMSKNMYLQKTKNKNDQEKRKDEEVGQRFSQSTTPLSQK